MLRIAIALMLATGAAHAAAPEIQRPPAAPQAVGAVHSLRGIPEACAMLQGRFTGQAAQPYVLAPVRSSASCQPRARFVDAAKAKPSTAAGWKLNDVIRVPSKQCAGLTAVVEVWRKPGATMLPELDAQGRARLYLQDVKADAAKAANVTQYAAVLHTDGACR